MVGNSVPSGDFCGGLDLPAPRCGGQEEGGVRHRAVVVPVLHRVALACHLVESIINESETEAAGLWACLLHV